MFLAFIIVLLAMGYLTTAGAFKVHLHKRAIAACHRGHGANISYYDRCSLSHTDASVAGGLLWPLMLPFHAGTILADQDKRKEAKAKRQKALAEQRIERANLEKKAIEQERRNLKNSIENLELEAGLKK